MVNEIVDAINDDPLWSFSREVAVEPEEYMELSLNCSLRAEVVDDSLVILVSPLDPLMPEDLEGRVWENLVKQEVWDRFHVVPSVIFYHPRHGFF